MAKGTVLLEKTDQPLDRLRPGGVEITWSLVEKGFPSVQGFKRKLGTTPLPAAMPPDKPVRLSSPSPFSRETRPRA